MTFLLWLYQFIGAICLGFMTCAAFNTASRPTKVELLMVIGLSIIWPYALYLIYRQGVRG